MKSPAPSKSVNVKLTYSDVMSAVRRVPMGEQFAGYGSVVDAIVLVTRQSRDDSAKVFRRLVEADTQSALTEVPVDQSEVRTELRTRCLELKKLPVYKFKGSGQRHIPVAPIKTLLMIIHIIPGCGPVVQFRMQCCEILCRVFAGDENLKVELDNNFAQLTEADRRDLLCEVPGAASVDTNEQRNANTLAIADSDTGSKSTHEIVVAMQDGSLTTITTRSTPQSTEANFLQEVKGLLTDIHVPPHIADQAGAYVGVKGEFVDVDGVTWVVVKVGKHDDAVELRIKTHGLDFTHWRTIWAGAITSIRCLPKKIEDKLKYHFRRRTGTLAIKGHQNEEFLIRKDSTVFKDLHTITRAVEHDLGSSVVGVHAYSDGLDTRSIQSEPTLDLARETTAQEQAKAEQEQAKAEQERSKVDLVLAQIQLLQLQSGQNVPVCRDFTQDRQSERSVLALPTSPAKSHLDYQQSLDAKVAAALEDIEGKVDRHMLGDESVVVVKDVYDALRPYLMMATTLTPKQMLYELGIASTETTAVEIPKWSSENTCDCVVVPADRIMTALKASKRILRQLQR